MYKKFLPGQSVKVEHAARVVAAVEDNPYFYEVEYSDGQHETVASARMMLLEDTIRATCDEDGSILIRSTRLSAAGARDMLTWLQTHLHEIEGTPDEALHREEAQLLADIATAQANITSLLERPMDGQDWQAEQVYSHLADGIARASARIAEIDTELNTQAQHTSELVMCESCKMMVDPDSLKMHVCPSR